MSQRADDDFLRDIREAVRRIKTYTDAMAYERFLADIKTQDAVVRNLEVIGEATKSLSAGWLGQSASDAPDPTIPGLPIGQTRPPRRVGRCSEKWKPFQGMWQ